MKVDLNLIREYESKGLLISQTLEDLTVFSYSREAMFDRKWDNITKMCRSLVVDQDGNIISKGFDKFFNLNEVDETKLENIIKLTPLEISKKEDGSFIGFFYYKGQWRSRSMGSFTSIYAQKALELFPKNNDVLPKDTTFICELILSKEDDPEIRPIRSDENKLIYLASINNNTHEEIDNRSIWENAGGSCVETFQYSLDDMINKSLKDSWTEGWVVKYTNGLRVKIKTLWYLDLFKQINNIRNIRDVCIDKMIVFGPYDHSWLKDFPEEFREELQKEADLIVEEYEEKINYYKEQYKLLYNSDRKTFALSMKNKHDSVILFAIYNNKNIKHLHWKRHILKCLKNKKNSKPTK